MTLLINKYYDLDQIKARIEAGDHRNTIGGMWDEIGRLQFDFIKARNLSPSARVLDIGCGCFRGGVHFIQYLNEANYFGLDVSQDLLDAGYEKELRPLGLDAKLPRQNLAVNFDFDVNVFDTQFDVALAQSVFTHLPLNQLKLCLGKLHPHMAPDAKLYATFFLVEDDDNWYAPRKHETGGITTFPDMDPFHYQPSDIEWIAQRTGWAVDYCGPWGHPRDQQMVIFSRR